MGHQELKRCEGYCNGLLGTGDFCLPCAIENAKSVFAQMRESDSLNGITIIEHDEWLISLRQTNNRIKSGKNSVSKVCTTNPRNAPRFKKPRTLADLKRQGDGVTCIRCGEKVKRGFFRDHLAIAHNERESFKPAAPFGRSKHIWVRVYSGGLPSLGRNSH